MDDNARISRSRRASSVRRLLFRSLFGPFWDGFCLLNSDSVRDIGRCGAASSPARSCSICDECCSKDDTGRCDDAWADSEPSRCRERRLFWRLDGRREGLRDNVGSAMGGSCARDDWRVVASSGLTWIVWRLLLRPNGHIAMAPGTTRRTRGTKACQWSPSRRVVVVVRDRTTELIEMERGERG